MQRVRVRASARGRVRIRARLRIRLTFKARVHNVSDQRDDLSAAHTTRVTIP